MDPMRKAKRPKAMPQAPTPLPRMADQAMHVLIAGGGVGGLTLAFRCISSAFPAPSSRRPRE
jgi:hypothetical protein